MGLAICVDCAERIVACYMSEHTDVIFFRTDHMQNLPVRGIGDLRIIQVHINLMLMY